MKRLFKDKTNYLPLAIEISNEVRLAIAAIIDKYIDVDARDLESVVKAAADDATLDMILQRKE